MRDQLYGEYAVFFGYGFEFSIMSDIRSEAPNVHDYLFAALRMESEFSGEL